MAVVEIHIRRHAGESRESVVFIDEQYAGAILDVIEESPHAELIEIRETV